MKRMSKPLILVVVGTLILVAIGFTVMMGRRLSDIPDDVPVISVPQQGGSDVPSAERDRYQEYSQDELNEPGGNRRVLFFHASWCPTCKVADAEFEKNASAIPEGVVVYKTDYDTHAELKKKYGVTYQHTFVQLDGQGNVVKKWNGGGIKELAANVQWRGRS